MANLNSNSLLLKALQRKMRPVILQVDASGIVQEVSGAPWFLPDHGALIGRALEDLSPVFCGLPLDVPLTLPLVELSESEAIELLVEPNEDGACIIALDASVMLNAVRSKQQLAYEHQLLNDKLKVLSRTDPLTGVYNRGHWQEQLQVEFKRYQRSGRPAALIMLDIDFFKAINDRHGHPVGDVVIQRLAGLLRGRVRATDTVGRYGGEEFAVLLPDTSARDAEKFAERLRHDCTQQVINHAGEPVQFNISLGVAEAGASTSSAADWLERADQALYAAKHAGRNRVCLASEAIEKPAQVAVVPQRSQRDAVARVL